jgi:uncharacterized protein (TIGR01777 family)
VRIVVAGGSGFLGRALVGALAARGHEVVVLTRSPRAGRASGPVRDVEWHPEPAGPATSSGLQARDQHRWMAEIDGAGVVVNLAGADLSEHRWTTRRKAELCDSRVVPTRRLVDAVRAAASRPGVFVQMSGVNFYGAAEAGVEEIVDESFPPGSDFLSTLCVDWEAQAQPAAALGCRVVIARSGVVLDRDHGALARMARPFRFLVGGRVASGRQYLSWIHPDDWIAFVLWSLDTPVASGALNATSPHPVTNAEFAEAIARTLRRPNWMPVPAFALKLVYGEMADVIVLRGRRVVPRRPIELGFRFRYPDIGDAMRAVLTR